MGIKVWDDRVFTLLFFVAKTNTYKLILNEMSGSISNPEEFKKRNISGKDFGHDWVWEGRVAYIYP